MTGISALYSMKEPQESIAFCGNEYYPYGTYLGILSEEKLSKL
jgi:hypothetical protein